MKVRFTARARRRQAAVSQWWRHNADHPDVFDQELLHALERLTRTPRLGAVYTTLDDREVRRVLLKKSKQHLYYWVDDDAGYIVLYTIWGVLRGDPES